MLDLPMNQFHVTNAPEAARSASLGTVAAFRERHGLSQSELGNIVARSRATISGWENGAPPDLAAQRLLWAIDANPGLVRSLAREPITVEDPTAKLREFITNANVNPDVRPIGDPDKDRFWVSKRNARMEVGLSVMRAMATAPGDAGGYLVGETTGDAVQGPLLPTSLARLGVSYVPMTVPELDKLVPVSLAIPTAQWLAEADEVSTSIPPVMQIAAGLKVVGCGVGYSRRLLTLTAGSVARLVARQVRMSLARAADAGALVGNSLLEPLGLASQATALGVATLDAAAVMDAIEDLEAAGVDAGRLGIVAGPSLKRAFGAINHDGRALWYQTGAGQYVAGIRALVNPDMPADEILIGAFDSVTVHHSADAVLVQRSTGADDGRETFAFLSVVLEVPVPGAFIRVFKS